MKNTTATKLGWCVFRMFSFARSIALIQDAHLSIGILALVFNMLLCLYVGFKVWIRVLPIILSALICLYVVLEVIARLTQFKYLLLLNACLGICFVLYGIFYSRQSKW
jgi:hypothetical protein